MLIKPSEISERLWCKVGQHTGFISYLIEDITRALGAKPNWMKLRTFFLQWQEKNL